MGVAQEGAAERGGSGAVCVGKLVLWLNEFYTSQIHISAWFVIRVRRARRMLS